MMSAMRIAGPSSRQWWIANLWHVVNVAVGGAIAAVITACLGADAFLAGYVPAVLAFMFLALFFAFVWPPIPMIELALLRLRRGAEDAAAFERPEPLTGAGSGERPRELRLHVPKRQVADRRRGEE